MTDFLNTKISRRKLAVGAAAGVLALHIGSAWADDKGAIDFVTSIANEVMGLANSGGQGNALRAKFSAVLNRYVSLHNIALFALGPYRDKLPAGQKEEFFRLFSNYAAALFVFYAKDFRGTGLEVISTTSQGGAEIIHSAIVGSGRREQVKWRVSGSNGSYRINDINVKGVWLTIATKKRFIDVLKKSDGDFAPLFDMLKEADTW